ncbi:dihydrolipoamide acetyltransferase family protein [Candidatus Viadribacter manganicus]|uniref:Dihydrolipoamide acetyltransferase component of pyruvate dehydrogenase complex n=1 Tax=Candidatus Viadribacter manganicus TaxID=1759059 RepID=A0A1B1AEX9_9PROT|nr:dihydrolipoamide acetyltransferase family protein [Candidatus Viadribacter manganicus]ANP45126.1 branched-chain alpha-keto acid dehydrogenase subunit E2 [Candidatus Viadribacter manganicus]
MGQFVFKLPDVGEGTAEAEIVAWHVRVGDVVKEDAPLVDVMTDKATVEMTAPVAGKIISLNGEPGDMAPVGGAIVVFEVQGEGEEEAAPAPPPPPPQAKAPPPAPPAQPAPKPKIKAPAGATWSEDEVQAAMQGAAPKATAVPAAAMPSSAAPKPKPAQAVAKPEPREASVREWSQAQASPAVRARAQKLGIDLGQVRGTGPDGRITHEDLDAVLVPAVGARRTGSALAEKNGIEPVKVIGLRRKIAEKMQDAKRRIPHFAYVEEADLTELEELRAHLNATKRNDQPKLTMLPFLMRALVLALPDFPQINARYDDENGVVYRHENVDIGIATQTDNGLIVPVVRHVEARDVWDSAIEVARLAAAVRNNSAGKDELSGSTITITSLGALGGIVTTPVINHPEVAIIGVNKLVERPVVKNGQIVVRKMMNLSSSFDHRVVDGYDAAAFIQRVKGLLEHPAALFIER